ncbi:hypothetical protein ACO22_04051 [Paracoccidioides brasiliensis]|uniref:Uncharacterized protein n=1 Tax=Paracoccidioides brasiliensis TaxID=121759 RepID=A0A1D2JE75_PARBR|nr:hypothetical protein ACO22_04051 [Paracoccidioides brasiliensis]
MARALPELTATCMDLPSTEYFRMPQKYLGVSKGILWFHDFTSREEYNVKSVKEAQPFLPHQLNPKTGGKETFESWRMTGEVDKIEHPGERPFHGSGETAAPPYPKVPTYEPVFSRRNRTNITEVFLSMGNRKGLLRADTGTGTGTGTGRSIWICNSARETEEQKQ